MNPGGRMFRADQPALDSHAKRFDGCKSGSRFAAIFPVSNCSNCSSPFASLLSAPSSSPSNPVSKPPKQKRTNEARPLSPVSVMIWSFPLIVLFHNTSHSSETHRTVEWTPILDKSPLHPDLKYLESILKLPNTQIQLGQSSDSKSLSPQLPAPQVSKKGQKQQEKTAKHRHKAKLPDEIQKRVDNALARKAAADGTEELLYKTLLNSDYYEKNVRPTYHHSKATNVTFGFLLNQIVEMDEKNQVLTTRCWLNINWIDRRLSWNSTEWEGIKMIYVPYKKLWTPDIILVNNAVREYDGSIMSTDIMATDTGNVTWLFSGLFTSSCQMRIRYYPFDSQECELRFASWSHDIGEIDLVLTTNQGDLSSYLNSTEFDLTDMYATRQNNHFPSDNSSRWPTIVITIKMERRPLFYVFNHILPCMLISAMAVFAFSMPPESGEKINMSITTMLSMGVYLQSITESIPPTSDAVPIIGQYYVASLFFVCLATAMNVISLNVHREGIISQGRHVPHWMEKFVLGYLATFLGMTIHEPDSITLLKSSQSKLSTIRRSSLLRDLKQLRTGGNTRKRDGKTGTGTCECILQNNNESDKEERQNKRLQFTDVELLEMQRNQPGESAFLQRMVHEQILPRMTTTKPAMLSEFEERFKKILKRIYRSLQQREIREEVVDERRKLQWQWLMLASVVDRFLLLAFSMATLMTITVFVILPVTLRDTSLSLL